MGRGGELSRSTVRSSPAIPESAQDWKDLVRGGMGDDRGSCDHVLVPLTDSGPQPTVKVHYRATRKLRISSNLSRRPAHCVRSLISKPRDEADRWGRRCETLTSPLCAGFGP